MSHPESRGGANNLTWTELHSSQVCEALSITTRQINYWTEQGIVGVESFKRGTRILATGSGTCRIYKYHHVLELALVRELHSYQGELEDVKRCLSIPPEGYLSWGMIISSYDPAVHGDTLSAISLRDEGVDLIRDRAELTGALLADLSCVHVNLVMLKDETDQGIRRVLSTGE